MDQVRQELYEEEQEEKERRREKVSQGHATTGDLFLSNMHFEGNVQRFIGWLMYS